MSPEENNPPPDKNPFEEIIKQLQKFIENLLKNSNFSALNFQEMLDQMMRQMGIDPEDFDEIIEELQKNQGFPGFAMGFQITMDPDGNPVVNPINPNAEKPRERMDINKKQPTSTPQDRYFEWFEIPKEEGSGWELIIEIPEVQDIKDLKTWLSPDSIHIESMNPSIDLDLKIPHDGRFDPKKKINIDFNNGILVVSQKKD